MLDFIERLRHKPEHVRRRIATGTAVTITGLVALGWIGALAAGNAFILAPTPEGPTLAQSSEDLQGAVTQARSGFSELMGAVGATDPKESSSLIIVEGQSTSNTAVAPTEETRTVIPF